MKVVFFGTPEFAVQALQEVIRTHELCAVVTQPDRPAGRGQESTASAVKVRAQREEIPMLQPATLKGTLAQQWLQDFGADVFVVVAYGRILPQAILDIPRLGSWNVHGSLLPALRGAAPIQWSIIHQHTVTGVSIMRMEAGLDTGPVAARMDEPIRDDDTAGALAVRLATLGARLLGETLPRIADGSVRLEPQDPALATIAPLLTKQDGRLDFAMSAAAVCARARGVDPWPGATAELAGNPVKLFVPKVVEGRGIPGEILGAGPAGLIVACGEAAVAFGQLQLPGRKRLPAAAVLAGNAIPTGSRFARAV